MKFDQLLTRIDESGFQELLGGDTVRVLNLIDPSLTTAKNLRQLLETRHPPGSLLRDPHKRSLLIDAMSYDKADELCAQLGLNYSNTPHERLHALRLRRNSPQEARLFRFFGIPEPEREPDLTEPTQTPIKPKYALFDHQRRVSQRTMQALAKRPRRALVHMPTGSGKTRTAMHVVAEYLRDADRGIVIWLAHSEELCNQACKELEKSWEHVGNREISLYRFWGSHSIDTRQIHDGVIVSAVPKIHSLAMKDLGAIGSLVSRTILVVLDEGHKATAATYKDLIETLLGPEENTALLGLTATPGRSWDDISADEELADLFNHQRIPLEVDGYDNPVNFLIDEGYLARPTFRPLHFNAGQELSDADYSALESDLDIPKKVLERLAEDEQRTLNILQTVESLIQRHERILVFSTTVSHAHLLAAILHARGIQAYAITGDTPGNERRRALQIYEEGGSDPVVLCNYGVLTTGFDAPRTSAGVIARPTKSLVLYSQMVGRMMRGIRAGGNHECEIVTVIDRNIPGFSGMADAFTYWNEIWGDSEQ